MSVYEQRLSPFEDDRFGRTAQTVHALEQPVAAALAEPPAVASAGTPARRSRPGLTGARPRSHARPVAGLVAVLVVAGALAAGPAGVLTGSGDTEALVRVDATTLVAAAVKQRAAKTASAHRRAVAERRARRAAARARAARESRAARARPAPATPTRSTTVPARRAASARRAAPARPAAAPTAFSGEFAP